ncbi:hypothetical protein NEMBOFW57_005221 [Staphylotrichum longicolle]|uniref:Uncharacterized protein n=1 Tax=Staphylotrichum longicolle TaxID=669026 RepID=A0AAD4EZX8_9PEZI|nr:hypothetical protein NEMBOFW57_005221 [Staphylotrichum longicolle]
MSPFAGIAGPLGGWSGTTRAGWQSNFNRSRNGIFQTATNRTTTPPANVLQRAEILAARSIRTSTIILASFNIIAAFATALGILCDSYFRKKRNDKKFRFWYDLIRGACWAGAEERRLLTNTRRNGFTFIPEAEIFPLVLSVGIFIQSFIFAGAQSTGLDSLFGLGCTWLAQLMLPAVFLAPYIQLVFAVEIAIRALRKKPFAPRGKYNVSVCLAIVGMLILANFLVADFDQSPNFCLTSLFWFVAHYSDMCFGLLVAIVVIVLVCAVIIFVRLHRSIKVEVTARVAASRMVYYLALASISNSFMIPFFFVDSFVDGRGQNPNALTLSMVASVVANVSGLMTGGLYLFLKSSTLSTIGPRDKVGEYENRRARYKITRYESNDSDDDAGDDGQVMNPVTGPRSLRRVDSEASLISMGKDEEAYDAKSIKSAITKNGRRSPDSLRSNKFASVVSALMPKAPEPARIPPAAPVSHMRKPQTKMATNDHVVHTLDCPNVLKELDMLSPKRAGAMGGSPTTAALPFAVAVETSMRDPVKDAKMKTLPPVPKINSQVPKAEPAQEEFTLSPTVYSPNTPTKVKLPSPKGVGFTVPAPKAAGGSPPRSPPRRRGTGDTTPVPTDAKGDWI